MKTYRGSPVAARHYVEADRGRADDYYLAEGTGVAERYTASPTDGVRRLAPLTGDGYAAWVAGFDRDTGAPKGRIRNDGNAVRFVEVTVNGPKSWSLAAELHPDISTAYDAAQDRAATQIIDWLAQHATSRVGPRGGQVQVPVTEIEAVTVRHYTSRAGDPHRHLHLQINARVFAEDAWRGLHTIGVRDSLDAINGIGHAAVMTDPKFREALAAHGFTLDQTGEVQQLAPFTGAFSARAAQIGRNIEAYEADWRASNPGREPGPATWRAWDARAWADTRPDKVEPRDGAEMTQRWVAELHALGYQASRKGAALDALPVGQLDRNVAHLVADTLDDAREQWVAVIARDRADLGPAHAAELAAAEASRYAAHRPFEQVMAELHRAWTVEQDCFERLVRDEQRRDRLREIVPLRAARDRELPPLEHAYRQAQETERDARQHAKTARTTLATDTDRIRDSLLDAWDTQHAGIRVHAQTVRDGTGRFGQRHAALTRAEAQLTEWADAWRPEVPDLPTSVERLADRVLWFENRPKLWDALDHAARGQAEHKNPDAVAALVAAETAADARRAASRAYRDNERYYEQALARYGNLAHSEHGEQQLTRLQDDLEATEAEFTAAQATIAGLLGEPTLRTLTSDRLTDERDQWRVDRDDRIRERWSRSAQLDADQRTHYRPEERGFTVSSPTPDHTPGISR